MNYHAQTSIEIFTTPTCPDCLALKRWLDARGLIYLERDLRDPAIAEEAKVRTGQDRSTTHNHFSNAIRASRQ